VLGAGVSFFGNHAGTMLLDDPDQVVHSDRVLHLHYTVRRRPLVSQGGRRLGRDRVHAPPLPEPLRMPRHLAQNKHVGNRRGKIGDTCQPYSHTHQTTKTQVSELSDYRWS